MARIVFDSKPELPQELRDAYKSFCQENTPLPQPDRGTFIANASGIRPLFYINCPRCNQRRGPYRNTGAARAHKATCLPK